MLGKNKKFSGANSCFRAFALSCLCAFCFLLSAFLPVAGFAQAIPDEIFGEYLGDARVTNELLGIDQTMPNITVELENRNVANDYFITIPDMEMMGIEIPVELDHVIITPFAGGYKLSRTESISFTLEDIYIPAIPPYLPEGVYDIPVEISLGNSDIIEYTLNLNFKVVATITYYLGPIPIPIPLTFNMAFNGQREAPPPSPPVIITNSLPSGIENQEYSALLEATGETPITWSIVAGTLPTGVTLDPITGSISGISTEANFFNFTVQAENIGGVSTQLLSIEIEEEQDTVGIYTPKIETFKVYPNPTTGVLNLINNEQLTINNVEILDVFGRLISDLRLSDMRYPTSNIGKSEIGKSEIQINISHLPAGSYFVKISTDSGVVIQKIMKY